METIRSLSAFLSRTAAGGGWRVAILDAADDLNRNAANALLKSLEEPPHKTAILLVANEPGRVLATIRSRCRRVDLRPVPDADIITLLSHEAGLEGEAADLIAGVARGRPGYALSLAAGEGADAIALAEGFIRSAAADRDVSGLAASFAGKTGADKWDIFLEAVLQKTGDAARLCARGEAREGAGLEAIGPARLVDAHARMTAIARRGEALNVDRGQILFSLGRTLRQASEASA